MRDTFDTKNKNEFIISEVTSAICLASMSFVSAFLKLKTLKTRVFRYIHSGANDKEIAVSLANGG